jgi:hypothetical protein
MSGAQGCLVGGPTTLTGRNSRLHDAVFSPRPIQRPHPMLILGVKGDRALQVAIRHGDEWNWNRAQPETAESLSRMDRLDELCVAAGRHPDSLPRGVCVFRRKRSVSPEFSITLGRRLRSGRREGSGHPLTITSSCCTADSLARRTGSQPMP